MISIMKRQKRLFSLLMAVFFLGATLGAQAGAPASGGKITTVKTTTKTTVTGKTSAFSALSPKNLLITTGVAVGTKLAGQIIKGQRVDIKGAAQSVATAEFAGSVVGSAIGAAGGSVVATVAKVVMPGPIGAIAGALLPVLGAGLGSQVGSAAGTSMRGQTQFRPMDVLRKIDYVDLAGSTIGSTIGMMLGAPIPVIGPIIGGIVGGFLGGKVAKWVQNFVKQNTSFSLGNWKFWNRGTNMGTGQTIGGSETIMGNPNGGVVTTGGSETVVGGFGTSVTPGGRPAADVAPTSAQLQAAEKTYYENYMQYNRFLEQGNNDEAKKMLGTLQKSSDEYNALKKANVAK